MNVHTKRENLDTSEKHVHVSDKNEHIGWPPGTVVRLMTIDGTHVGNAVIGEKGPADAT